jgi:hypothetical protein
VPTLKDMTYFDIANKEESERVAIWCRKYGEVGKEAPTVQELGPPLEQTGIDPAFLCSLEFVPHHQANLEEQSSIRKRNTLGERSRAPNCALSHTYPLSGPNREKSTLKKENWSEATLTAKSLTHHMETAAAGNDRNHGARRSARRSMIFAGSGGRNHSHF